MLTPLEISQLQTIKPKLEAALATYLRQLASNPASPLHGTYIAEILFAQSDEETSPGDEDYEVELWIYVMTQRDDETAVMHDRRLGAARKALADLTAVQAAVNRRPGEDTRAVKDFHLIGGTENRPTADEAREAERRFGEHLRYRFFAANYDVLR
jgi:hypothetical protein